MIVTDPTQIAVREYRRTISRAQRVAVRARANGGGAKASRAVLDAQMKAARDALDLARRAHTERRRTSAPLAPATRRSVIAKAAAQMIARPKSPRERKPSLLLMARGRPCLLQSPICNRDPLTTVACHGAGIALGKGTGYKLSDVWTVWGCSSCNHYTDAYKDATAEQKALVFARGHERQLAAWQSIADSPNEKNKDREAARWALARWQDYINTRGGNHV